MQAWPVYWAHRKGLSRTQYMSGYETAAPNQCLSFSHSFISVVNSYGQVLLWVIQFWFCEQTQKHTPKCTAFFTSMLTQQYQAAVGHDRWCVVTVTLHGCHGGHHRCCESIHCLPCHQSQPSVSGWCQRPNEFIEFIWNPFNKFSVRVFWSKARFQNSIVVILLQNALKTGRQASLLQPYLWIFFVCCKNKAK